ncbi:hypothetical protein WG907_12415 [Sphingobium sp. AN558]
MHYFSALLERQPFVAGDSFSMAEYARMQERPSVKNRVTMSDSAG